MALFSSNRTILIQSDKGLQIYRTGSFGARLLDVVPWDTVDFDVSVAQIISKKAKRSPVVILNDMVEQHYRKERVPTVGLMDQANVLRRRLSIAFPSYRIRAAIKLKDKVTGTETAKGTPYLFAAVPVSDQFQKTLDAIKRSGTPVLALCLLPVEASTMVRDLSLKVNKGQVSKNAWNIFVGQHHNGGLRQIVVRNGELALTRMTPIVDTDVEPQLWAKEVSGELSATMSYLGRLGYKQGDALNIIIIANETCKQALENFIRVECNLNIMDAQKAASYIGIKIGRQEDLRYVDPLHAAYLSKKSKFLLPMETQAISNMTQPRKVAAAIMLLLLAGCGYFGFKTFQSWQESAKQKDQLKVAVQQNQSLKQEYERELEKKKALGFDYKLVDNSIQIYNGLQKQKLDPSPVLRELGRSLGADLHIDKLSIFVTEEKVRIPSTDDLVGATEEKFSFMNAVMTISFPNSVEPEEGVRRVNMLRDRIQNNLPGYEVGVIKQVADLSYTGNFEGQAGTSDKNQNVPDRYEAEIKIVGKIEQQVSKPEQTAQNAGGVQ